MRTGNAPDREASPTGMAASEDHHARYVLRHGDDNLVLAQRLAAWISRAPEIEEDIALGNIALDHLGQARLLLALAGELEGEGRDEDRLAMFRPEREYTNLQLVEQPNGDFAHTVVRSLFFDHYQVRLWAALQESSDPRLAGVAAKAHKEALYHRRHSTAWTVRLGDGTDESHRRMQRAVDSLWPFTTEMFDPDETDRAMTAVRFGVDPAGLRAGWDAEIDRVLGDATLTRPPPTVAPGGGRRGIHTEHLGHLLAEMQWMQRSHPGLEW